MRIEQNDIDCLIEISVFFKSLVDAPKSVVMCTSMREWHERLRKIYILLMQASDKGQLGLERLVKEGIPDNSAAAEAIRALCPHTGRN